VADDRYLLTKVSETLLGAGGDRKQAERLLLEAAGRDPRLLKAMIAPYLPTIAARTVAGVCDRAKAANAAKAAPKPAAPAAGKPTPQRAARAGLSPRDLDTIVGQLGSRIGAVPLPGGLDALLRPAVQPKAGPRHEQSIRQIALAFARNRYDHPG
jgi:hypothetical protein